MDEQPGSQGVGTGAPGGATHDQQAGGRPADETRPPLRRPREGRIVAGVAAGLSDHLNLDVAIVRILLVVLTIVTSGVALLGYVAAILLIPAAEVGAPRDVARPRGGVGTPRDPLFWVGVGLLVVGALWLIGGPLSGVGPRATGLLGELAVPLVLIAFGLALWRAGERRGAPGSTPPPGAPVPPPSGHQPPSRAWPAVPTSTSTGPIPSASAQHRAATTEPPVTTDVSSSPAPGTAPSTGTTPAAGTSADPVDPGGRGADPGTGTAAWETAPIARAGGGDQPPPPPGTSWPSTGPGWTPPPAPERTRSLLTRVTLGLSLVTAGMLWILRGTGVLWVSWGQIAAASLLVLGIGLLIGSVAGRGRWLILAGALIAPVVLAWQITSPWAGDDLGNPVGGALSAITDGRPSGEIREVPMEVDRVRSSYELGAGSIDLDLSQLDLDGETLATSLEVGAGEIVVIVPDDVDVDVRARSGIGEVSLFGTERATGINPGSRTATHEPDDPNGRIELELDAGLGEVRVDLVPVARD